LIHWPALPAGRPALHISYSFQLQRANARGVRGFRVFLACLVLGVGAIAGIGSLTEALVAASVATRGCCSAAMSARG